MTWGGDAYVDIPNGTTWNGWATGREWESAGTGLDLWTGGVEFHLYYDLYPWTTAAWTEFTPGMQSFSIRRGVRSWWEGMSAGSAVVELVNDAEVATVLAAVEVNAKWKITVDVPSGEQDLFVGFVRDEQEFYDAESATATLILQDHIGYTGQAVYTARNFGAGQTTGWVIDDLLRLFGNQVQTADRAGINTATGLTVGALLPAGNLVNALNQYVQGELGMLWVDASGVFQFLGRDWWYPQPNPVATIGSLDRSAGGSRTDPTHDTGYKFPLFSTRWVRPLGINQMTWNYYGGSTFTNYNTASQSGIRSRTATVHLTSGTDVANNLSFLIGVIGDDNIESDTVEIRFPAGLSAASMDYAATADVSDFIEVAKETTKEWAVKRTWKEAWVMGVNHDWNPNSGWTCTLVADPNLALFDFAVPE